MRNDLKKITEEVFDHIRKLIIGKNIVIVNVNRPVKIGELITEKDINKVETNEK